MKIAESSFHKFILNYYLCKNPHFRNALEIIKNVNILSFKFCLACEASVVVFSGVGGVNFIYELFDLNKI